MDVKRRILMFPWLAQGHITPLLELAKKLIKRNSIVYICTTQVNINALKPNIEEESSELIQFVELKLPSLPELPPVYHTTRGLPRHLINTLVKALYMAKDDFCRIVETLKPDLVIYDVFQPWAAQVASSLNIPAVFFICVSAAIICFSLFLVKKHGEAFPFPEIFPRVNLVRYSQKSESSPGDINQRTFDSIERSCDLILVNSFGDIEAKFIDLLTGLSNKKVIPVGPLVQVLPSKDDSKPNLIIEWMKKKQEASVLYVSFGSECYLTNKELQAIARELEVSNMNFIWVIRFPEGAKISLEEALPEGFLKRVGDRGLVLEDWAPQARILAHPNTGGFLSHCGWNSVLESMNFGVPIVAFPMQLEQPVHARLVEEVGCGMEVQKDVNGEFQEGGLARVIREVIVEESGETVRKRARELKDIIRKMLEEEKEIDEALQELVELQVNT